VVQETVIRTPPKEESEIPKWVIIPVAVIAGLAILLLFIFFIRNQGEPQNANLKVTVNRGTTETRETKQVTIPSTDTGQVSVPSTTAPADSQTVTVPGTSGKAPDDRGTVVVNAKLSTRNGQTQPVRNERFYLLDKDVDSILSDARLEPIEGNSLINSFGLSVSFPDRYGDFNRRALAAIRPHIKHAATSDASGKAEFGSVEPDNYYLFGVTHNGQGFALWSSPVLIRAGVNNLDLSPQPLNEIAG